MEIIRICAWCGRGLEGGTNTPIGKPVENHSHIGNVSHGICDACKAKIEKEMSGCKSQHKKARHSGSAKAGWGSISNTDVNIITKTASVVKGFPQRLRKKA